MLPWPLLLMLPTPLPIPLLPDLLVLLLMVVAALLPTPGPVLVGLTGRGREAGVAYRCSDTPVSMPAPTVSDRGAATLAFDTDAGADDSRGRTDDTDGVDDAAAATDAVAAAALATSSTGTSAYAFPDRISRGYGKGTDDGWVDAGGDCFVSDGRRGFTELVLLVTAALDVATGVEAAAAADLVCAAAATEDAGAARAGACDGPTVDSEACSRSIDAAGLVLTALLALLPAVDIPTAVALLRSTVATESGMAAEEGSGAPPEAVETVVAALLRRDEARDADADRTPPPSPLPVIAAATASAASIDACGTGGTEIDLPPPWCCCFRSAGGDNGATPYWCGCRRRSASTPAIVVVSAGTAATVADDDGADGSLRPVSLDATTSMSTAICTGSFCF